MARGHGEYYRAYDVRMAYEEGERDFTDGEALYGEDFEGEDLSGADFSRSNLDDADLTGANLRDVKFCSTNLGDANLENADCADVDWTGATISRSNRSIITILLEQAAEQSPDLDLLDREGLDRQHDRFTLISALRDEDDALCWDSTLTWAVRHNNVDAVRWALDTLSTWACFERYCRIAHERLAFLLDER